MIHRYVLPVFGTDGITGWRWEIQGHMPSDGLEVRTSEQTFDSAVAALEDAKKYGG